MSKEKDKENNFLYETENANEPAEFRFIFVGRISNRETPKTGSCMCVPVYKKGAFASGVQKRISIESKVKRSGNKRWHSMLLSQRLFFPSTP
jgi:hypothetical protein